MPYWIQTGPRASLWHRRKPLNHPSLQRTRVASWRPSLQGRSFTGRKMFTPMRRRGGTGTPLVRSLVHITNQIDLGPMAKLTWWRRATAWCGRASVPLLPSGRRTPLTKRAGMPVAPPASRPHEVGGGKDRCSRRDSRQGSATASSSCSRGWAAPHRREGRVGLGRPSARGVAIRSATPDAGAGAQRRFLRGSLLRRWSTTRDRPTWRAMAARRPWAALR